MVAVSVVRAEPMAAPSVLVKTTPNISEQNEIRLAIDKGLAWLQQHQNTNGYWSTPDQPAITALALEAYEMSPGQDPKAIPPGIANGYRYVVGCVQPDGGIYRKELQSYNTSVSLVALVLAHRPEYRPLIINARHFIIGLQNIPESGDTNDTAAGGIGYGNPDKQPDLSNTAVALEALRVSQMYETDTGSPGARDLNWPAAIRFIQSCQNPAAADDVQDKGGFIYAPGESNAGETNLPSGRVALRSYGSMSYAGLLSYIYADLKPDDPRVMAVMDWLRANYTLDENPALGPQGLFYYYHTMAKALTVYGANVLDTKNGQSVNWREQLAFKLINLQKADGSWANDNGRWFERDPSLVTAYSLIALDTIYPKM
jgi:squalene-hopene/tetraprenyl-beta-curcumene cyclase